MNDDSSLEKKTRCPIRIICYPVLIVYSQDKLRVKLSYLIPSETYPEIKTKEETKTMFNIEIINNEI